MWLSALFLAFCVPLTALIGSYVERKIAGFVQDRLGPNTTGKYGLLQAFADIIKLLQKEDIALSNAHWWWFRTAPILILITVLGAMSLIPIGASWHGVGSDLGLYYGLGILSLEVTGLMMAGWASGNNFSLIGAMRGLGLLVSYELPFVLSLLGAVLWYGHVNLEDIVLAQSRGGLWSWGLFAMPALLPVCGIFFISSLAEANRAPFDLAEAESEIISGFHTEYTGTRWALVMLSEYGLMLFTSLLGVCLFWGGWSSPVEAWPETNFWAVFWLFLKTLLWFLTQIIMRWVFPRLRLDQLMRFSWLILLPTALVWLLVLAFLRYYHLAF